MDDRRDPDNPSQLILAEETYAVVGAAMEVYYKLGTGFLEPVYQQALAIELGLRDVPFVAQKPDRIQGTFDRKGIYCGFCMLRSNNCGN